MNVAKQMSQREKNMVMIGAALVSNTINENTLMPDTIKQQIQNNTTSAKMRIGSFVGAGDGFHNAEGLAKIIPLGDDSTVLRLGQTFMFIYLLIKLPQIS
jgi:hypothetical protein